MNSFKRVAVIWAIFVSTFTLVQSAEHEEPQSHPAFSLGVPLAATKWRRPSSGKFKNAVIQLFFEQQDPRFRDNGEQDNGEGGTFRSSEKYTPYAFECCEFNRCASRFRLYQPQDKRKFFQFTDRNYTVVQQEKVEKQEHIVVHDAQNTHVQSTIRGSPPLSVLGLLNNSTLVIFNPQTLGLSRYEGLFTPGFEGVHQDILEPEYPAGNHLHCAPILQATPQGIDYIGRFVLIALLEHQGFYLLIHPHYQDLFTIALPECTITSSTTLVRSTRIAYASAHQNDLWIDYQTFPNATSYPLSPLRRAHVRLPLTTRQRAAISLLTALARGQTTREEARKQILIQHCVMTPWDQMLT